MGHSLDGRIHEIRMNDSRKGSILIVLIDNDCEKVSESIQMTNILLLFRCPCGQ